MADILYAPYLLALLILPLLVRWRWGLAAALIVTVAELGLVLVVNDLAAPANPYPLGRPDELPPGESPLVQIRRNQAFGMATAIMWILFPGMAALIGGALAVVWSVILAIRRASARQP
jgi:hypothetical protein